MKSIIVLVFILFACCMNLISQQSFDLKQYENYLNSIIDMEQSELANTYKMGNLYLDNSPDSMILSSACFMDSVKQKLKITEGEINLMKANSFVVTERLSYDRFEDAFMTVFYYDLPLFVSTDAMLQTIHQSYDEILKELEARFLNNNLKSITQKLYNGMPALYDKYKNADSTIKNSIKDVDLYVTIAYSLSIEAKKTPHYESSTKVDEVLDAINKENLKGIELFCNTSRDIDFSQFKVRGHYAEKYAISENDSVSLKAYFRTMMWLGRIDFLLTQIPDHTLSYKDLQRMNIDAFLLNQLLDISGARELIKQNNDMIDILVGESDNLTTDEYSKICKAKNINAEDFLIDSKYKDFVYTLINDPSSIQLILSDCFSMCSNVPDTLPISFKLMGQRFILDSYILSNVVFDRIVYNDQKIWRPLPSPLDAMFVLGSNTALPLLNNELTQYHYASQLGKMRYLTDMYDTTFWDKSIYNSWLQTIRKLNQNNQFENYPNFMKTQAWQQEKLNTQLASWTQLRHDNVLYAKQSYTGGAMCSYPYVFVEPNPDFYAQIEKFAAKSLQFFSITVKPVFSGVDKQIAYYTNLRNTSKKLKNISQKELNGEIFDTSEIDFLKKIIVSNSFGCGGFPNGWYTDLIYNYNHDKKEDFLIVDVHTQPYDEAGNPVGNILHTAIGKVNMGLFLAKEPLLDNKYTIFCGPVMSYYEKVTSGFHRLTDQEWKLLVEEDSIPDRPDWVNIYLAGKNGTTLPQGRKINELKNLQSNTEANLVSDFTIYPNPSNGYVKFRIPEGIFNKLDFFDYTGRLLFSKSFTNTHPGEEVTIDFSNRASGIYLIRLSGGGKLYYGKLLLKK